MISMLVTLRAMIKFGLVCFIVFSAVFFILFCGVASLCNMVFRRLLAPDDHRA